ncbi:hypothetical protein [Serratia proteamaculans]|uniref:hypothetical protein n=1 Tax=Serratia proteamaculans TaxID=28151 RepID=UPI002176F341|nr:hypothetical protein [Serratia proteamaculans]CAI0978815.1 Uncharacterised protein [Serratia proteamaculans]CAI1064050.1 Uncharacterised protein [Serratia proteamaculans]CAI1970556.1 Uncharacterised protein [Serratia proteamaculans]
MNTCPDIATLRTIIPASSEESIEVISYYPGWSGEDKLQSGGGVFIASNNPELIDDAGIYIKPNSQWTWVRVLSSHSLVSPNMYGARGDGIADDTSALTAAFSSTYSTICQQGATYMTSDTVQIKNGQDTRKVINLNGATIKAKAGHLKPFFASKSSTPGNYDYLHGVEMFGGRLYGWVKRESVYHQVSAHNGFVAGDKSYFYHMTVRGFCDGMVLMGNSVAFDVNIDECRDNLIVVKNNDNVVSNITGGYCLGDGILVKGSKNIVAKVTITGAGIPASTFEPGYVSGSIIALGQDSELDGTTSDCYVIDVKCGTWGGGGVIVDGENNFCDNIEAGDCYYLEQTNASAILNGAPAVYTGGSNHRVNNVKVGHCIRGVEIHDGSKGNRIDNISIASCRVHPGLSASGNQSDSHIGELTFGRLTGNKALDLNMSGLVIEQITVNEYASAFGSGGSLCSIKKPVTIGSLVFNSQSANNILPVVLMEANASISNLVVNNNKAVCLQTTAAVTQLPQNLTIQQTADAIDSAVKLFGNGASLVKNWQIRGNPTVLPSVRGTDTQLTIEHYPSDSLPWKVTYPTTSKVIILSSTLVA